MYNYSFSGHYNTLIHVDHFLGTEYIPKNKKVVVLISVLFARSCTSWLKSCLGIRRVEQKDECKCIKFCFFNGQIHLYISYSINCYSKIIFIWSQAQPQSAYPFSNVLKIMGLKWVVLLYKLMRPITVEIPTITCLPCVSIPVLAASIQS